MSTARDVASAVLKSQGAMTPMQLQKLVYYCQAWHLAHHGQSLFPERVEAWQQGPVVADLWRLNKYSPVISSIAGGDAGKLSAVEADTVNWVLTRYGRFSAAELSHLTHIEAPWVVTRGDLPPNAYSDQPISHELMGSFYARQIDDARGAVTHAVASAAIEGLDLDADWQEALRDVAQGTLDADELIQQEIARLGRS